MVYNCSCCGLLSRRRILAMAGMAGAATLPGCAAYNELAASTVSPEQEAQMGRQAFTQIKAETPISRNAGAQARVEKIASRVVPASGSSIPFSQWEVVVFDSDEINAFALPGGHIGVYRGILDLANNDAEIATVLGHEVGHVNAHHAAQRIGTGTIAEGALSVAGLAGQAYGISPQMIGMLGGAGLQYGVLLPFSRYQESQADDLGLHYMARAAYDPEAAINFWKSMSAAGGAKPAVFLSTHPSDGQRIAELENKLPEVMPIYQTAKAQA